jgi:hypothetical protein
MLAMEHTIASMANVFGNGPIEVRGARRTWSGRSYFELRGVVNGTLASMHVAVPANLSAAETWIVWCYELQRCGALVVEDETYSANILNGRAWF